MKKFLYFLTVVLMAVGLTACFGSGNVAKFSIGVANQKGTTSLVLTPDYAKRTFSVDYKKDSTDKLQKSVTASGQMGGEYFDRFESMSKVVENYTKKSAKNEVLPVDVSSDKLKAIVEGKDKTISTMEVPLDDASTSVQDMKTFYNDIVKLLTAAAPV